MKQFIRRNLLLIAYALVLIIAVISEKLFGTKPIDEKALILSLSILLYFDIRDYVSDIHDHVTDIHERITDLEDSLYE